MSRSRRAARGLAVDEVEGAGLRAGLRPDDLIVAIDGRPPEDVLDLTLAAADGDFTLTVARGRRSVDLAVTLRPGEEHGLTLRDGLGMPVRRCVNDCPFCFVAQVPAGLRPSLAVRDDDYRLSFLQGTFVTLTNLDGHDLERITRLGLSPLYVSLHAWDDEARERLMGPHAAAARARLVALVRCGIAVHVQVVLCPGVNDGALLRETLEELLALAAGGEGAGAETRGATPADAVAGAFCDGPTGASSQVARRGGVVDVGVVPVSLSRESEGLRRVTPVDARAALGVVADAQAAASARVGRRFAHGADELYLLVGATPPAGDAPEQYENGVGICAALMADVERARLVATPDLALLGGEAAAPVLAAASLRLAARTGAAARPFVVANRLFGSHVSVTGLLGGREIIAALRERPLAPGEWLLAPRTIAPPGLERTLDDVPLVEIAAACDGRLAVGQDVVEALTAARAGYRAGG